MIAKHIGCKPHEYQDATYGKGFRVMNPVAVSGNSKEEPGYRCTVCAPPKVKSLKRGGVFKRSELVVLRG
jgi:hypothetical protein